MKRLNWKYILLILVSTPILFITFLFLLVGTGALGKMPTKNELANIKNPLSSKLYDRNEHQLAEYYIENRTNVELEDISEDFLNALIATEDIRFYKHHGIDFRSLGRVFFKTILLRQSSSGGGSTLTQQLVKNLYSRKSYWILSSPINKVREMFVAWRIENIYTKEEILKLYVNTVSFGERAFGINTASNRFFNKTPIELTLSESATLVGILKAPSYYSPRRFPERAQRRRNTVFSQMNKYGFLDEEEMLHLQSDTLILDYLSAKGGVNLIAYAKNQVKKEFRKLKVEFPKEDGSFYDLYTDGLRIYTTLDRDLQRSAENIVSSTMPQVQKQFFDGWKGSSPFKGSTRVIDDAILRHPMYQKLKNKGLSNKEALEYFTTHAERKVWTWNGYEDKHITIIDSIKHYLTLLQCGMMAMDPRSGEILVWIGGNDFGEFQFDNVSSARQVGSTFKPITYLVALEEGKDPCEFYPNELKTYADYKDWTPENAGNNYGGSYSMHGALAHSINTVSVDLILELGPGKVVDKAHQLGVNKKLPEVPSLVLGTADVSMVEMLQVYSSFLNGGKKVEPNLIKRIENSKGELLYSQDTFHTEEVIDPEISTIMIEMLQNATEFGSGRRIKSYNLPVHIAGKTGTTQNQSDGWFIGGSPNLVCGAWVGTDDRRIHFRNLGTGSGGRTALPLVGQFFKSAYSNRFIEPIPFELGEAVLDCVDFSEIEADEMNRLRAKELEEDGLFDLLENIFKTEDRKDRRRKKRKKRSLKERFEALIKESKRTQGRGNIN